MASKAGIIISVVIAFLIIAGLIGGFVYFGLKDKVTFGQSIVPPQCEVSTTGTDLDGSYSCPSTVDSCDVTLTLQCNNKVATDKVIFRTNAIISTNPNYKYSSDLKGVYQGKWLVVDSNNDGYLEEYAYSSYGTSSNWCQDNTYVDPVKKSDGSVLLTKDNLLVFKRTNGYIYLCSGTLYAGFTPSTTTGAVLVNTPTSPFSTNNQEVTDGNVNAYQCSQKTTGSKVATVTYSGKVAGTSSEAISLTSGQTIGWIGRMDYKEIDLRSSECTLSTPDANNPNVYYLCVADQFGCGKLDKTNAQHCPSNQVFKIDSQKCEAPYTVNINLAKSVISTEEKFNLDFELTDTTNNQNIPVTVQICKGTDCSFTTKTQITGNNYQTAGKTSFVIDAPPVGIYTLKVSFSSSQGDYSKEYNVQVTQPLSVVVTADNPIQFDNSDIVAYLKSFRSGKEKALTSYEIQAFYNGAQQYQYTIGNPSLGVLKFSFSGLKGDGILRIRARGEDESGLWTDWTDYFEITVNKATILFKTDFPADKCTGSYTLNFETTDSLNNPVETQNLVTIDKPLGGTDTVSSSGKDGKYSLTYNFVDGGVYTVRITSSNSQLGSSQLRAGHGEIVNILTGSACGSGGGGGTSFTTYIIIGVAILAVGLFIYFVFFFRRK